MTNSSVSIIGTSPALMAVVQKAQLLANVFAPVLIQGETGVGKDVFARFIHESGPQHRGPFVALNCGGLPRELLSSELFGYAEGAFTGARRSGMIGKLEAAHGGTLFLDEISEMPLDLQPYLLRVLENFEVVPLGSTQPRQVRFRLVAACNRDLRLEALAGRFRVDLYYRLSVTELSIPPLRARSEDVPELVAHFTQAVTQRHGLGERTYTPEVMCALSGYPWPGNVRELRNVLEGMILLSEGPRIDVDMLPETLRAFAQAETPRPGSSLQVDVEHLEAESIRRAIRKAHGNLTQASRQLRIARSTLYLKIKKYSLDRFEAGSRYALGDESSTVAIADEPGARRGGLPSL